MKIPKCTRAYSNMCTFGAETFGNTNTGSSHNTYVSYMTRKKVCYTVYTYKVFGQCVKPL